MKLVLRSIRILLVFAAILGLGYPLLVTFIAHWIMPVRSGGSFVIVNGQPRGSSLLGQVFTNAGYFHSRPSAGGYSPLASGATSLGPTSRTLYSNVLKSAAMVRRENGLTRSRPLPSDMVTASASGLDPHISVENAMIQADRVAKARGIPLETVWFMINASTDPAFLGFWGEPGVNVLKLNLSLDRTAKQMK